MAGEPQADMERHINIRPRRPGRKCFLIYWIKGGTPSGLLVAIYEEKHGFMKRNKLHIIRTVKVLKRS